MVTRRDMLCGSAALATMAGLPRAAVASVKAGAGQLTTISDGHLELPKSFILGSLPEATADPILAAAGQSGDLLRQPCNITLYRDDSRTVLFDVGSGTEFVPTAGELIDGLDALDLAPEDVTDVIFTHGHPDHLWGLLDDFGDPLFTEAAFHMGQAEWDYWTDPNTVSTIQAERQSMAVGAARRLELIADQISLFNDGDEVLPGIGARATFGHTPGHMALEVGTKDPVLVVGDAIGNAHVSMANPAWELGSDQDSTLGARTRADLVTHLAKTGTRLVGFHFPGTGFGRIERAGTGFIFIEETI